MIGKLVKGFGINDADYTVKVKEDFYVEGKRKFKNVWSCPFYGKWLSMLERTNGEKYKAKKPTYLNKTVCEEWRYFMKFKSWMEVQIWEGLELDKDIIQYGNTVYSPETCAFVPRYINMALSVGSTKNSELPIGVSRMSVDKKMVSPHKRPFIARVNSYQGGTKHLGAFEKAEDAHRAWQLEKANVIEAVVVKYRKEICFNTKVADGLMQRVWKLRLDHAMNIETKQL